MIKGIGVDLVEKKRIERVLNKFGDRFIKKILTEEEQKEYLSKNIYSRKVSFLSNNFASKEAAAKVIGTGFTQGVTLKDIEVLREESGLPYLLMKGEALKKAEEIGCKNFLVTISDTKEHSLAFVLGEGL